MSGQKHAQPALAALTARPADELRVGEGRAFSGKGRKCKRILPRAIGRSPR